MVKITSKINEDLVRINKKEASKNRSSIFAIVINPNKSYANDYEGKMKAIEKVFYKACEYLFAKKNIMKLLKCVCKGCKLGDRCTTEQFHDKIISVNCMSSVEVGSQRGFLHVNTTLNVIHKTKVHVNTQRLRDVTNLFMSKVIDKPNAYVGVRCLVANLHNNINYVSHAKEYKSI